MKICGKVVAAIGALDHLHAQLRIARRVVLDVADALAVEQPLGRRAVAAALAGVDDDIGGVRRRRCIWFHDRYMSDQIAAFDNPGEDEHVDGAGARPAAAPASPALTVAPVV